MLMSQPPPLTPRRTQLSSAAPSFGSAALRSELEALRAAEGRLDALRTDVRRTEVAGPSEVAVTGQVKEQQMSSSSSQAVKPVDFWPPSRGMKAWPQDIQISEGASRLSRAPRASGTVGLRPGNFIFDLELDRFFAAWCAVCADMRAYWRQRRNENSRKWLGNRSSAVALWSFFSSLRCHVHQPLKRPSRGVRVREKETNFSGTFYSCSEKGICKIQLDGQQEVCFREAESLWEIVSSPHPFLAGLAFLAWTLSHAEHEDLKIDGLRTALMFNQVMGKSAGKLTMMAVMQEEANKGLKFCFGAWKKAMKSKSLSKFRLNRQREIFRAWLEVLFMDKHDRAIETLESTRLSIARTELLLLKKKEQCNRIKAKFDKMHCLCLDLTPDIPPFFFVFIAKRSIVYLYPISHIHGCP